MGKITLSEGFTVIPEGTHIFKIIEVNYKEQFGKLEIKMKTAKGQTHIERFSLLKADGSTNEGALNAFSYFVEADGKKILFTGDLRHPTVDFPAPAFEEELDLILCELAHFSADDCIPVFDKPKAKRILHTHISPRWHESLARQLAAKHPYAYGAAFDGLELEL